MARSQPSVGAGPRPDLWLWGLGLAAAGVPLAWSHAVAAVFTLPKLAVLAAAVLLCAAAAVGRPASARPWRATPLDLPLAAVAGAALLSFWLSDDRALSAWGRHEDYGYFLLSLGLCAALYYCAAWTDARGARTALACASAAGALSGALAAAQRLGLDPVGARMYAERASAAMGGPSFLGSYLALLFPLCLHLALTEGGAWGWGTLAAAAAGLLSAVALGSWLAAGAGAAAYLLLSGRWRRPDWGPRGWAALGAAALALAALAFALASRRDLAPSVLARLGIWTAAWRAFLERPWLGHGPDTFELVSRRLRSEEYVVWAGSQRFSAHAHNLVLDLLATGGLLGLGAALWLLAACARAARAGLASPEKPWAPALAAGLLAYLVNLQISPGSTPGLALAALFAGLLCGAAPEQAPEARRRLLGAGLLLASLAAAAAAGRMCLADRRYLLALRAESAGDLRAAYVGYREALAAAPCELLYQRRLSNLLMAGAKAQPDDQARAPWVAESSALADRSLACHPRHYQAHYLRGFATFQQGALARDPGLIKAAGVELDEALRLNPDFLPLVVLRRRAAEAAGERELLAALDARVKRLELLLGPWGNSE